MRRLRRDDMQVLDIDLDFFLNDTVHFADDYGARLDESEYGG